MRILDWSRCQYSFQAHSLSCTNLESKAVDGLAVLKRLGRGYGAGELDVVDTEVAEHRRDLDLVLSREEGVGKLSTELASS